MATGRGSRLVLRIATGLAARVHLLPARDHRPVLVQRLQGGDLADHRRSPSSGTAKALADTRPPQAILTSIAGRHRGDRSPRSSSAALIALAVQRYKFFGRETISFVVILPLALPGHRHRPGAEHGVRTDRHPPRDADDHHRPRHVLRRRSIYNNVIARLRRTSRSFEEASADLGADTFTTFRKVTGPAIRTRPARRRPARVRALVRRDHRHELHVERGHADPADLDLQQLPAPEPAPARERRGGLRAGPARSSRSTSRPGSPRTRRAWPGRAPSSSRAQPPAPHLVPKAIPTARTVVARVAAAWMIRARIGHLPPAVGPATSAALDPESRSARSVRSLAASVLGGAYLRLIRAGGGPPTRRSPAPTAPAPARTGSPAPRP